MTTQTTRMMSILSTCYQNARKNNTMTINKTNGGINTSFGVNTTAFLGEGGYDEASLE
jgi:hypothetical protein